MKRAGDGGFWAVRIIEVLEEREPVEASAGDPTDAGMLGRHNGRRWCAGSGAWTWA